VKPSAGVSPRARTLPSPSWRLPKWPASSRAGSASQSGDSPTPAQSRRLTPSTSPELHWAPASHQDGVLLPRPPRRAMVSVEPPPHLMARQTRPPRCLRAKASRPDRWSSRRSFRSRPAGARARLCGYPDEVQAVDHRACDDEYRDRPAGPGLPGGCATSRTATARSSSLTR